jgi:adenosylmethionine---8-amino-7-oxononanoate aminotransferase
VKVLDAQGSPLNWYDAGLRHLWLRPEGAEPLAVALTHGSRILLDDERELLDGTGGGWTACHGFNHPHIGMAVARQLERMPHAPLDGMIHQQPAKLAGRLAKLLPGDLDHVVFSESGSDAMENAVRIALRYCETSGGGLRRKFLGFRGGWHGGTAAAVALSDPALVRDAPHRNFVARQYFARLPSDPKSMAAFESLLARHGEKLAAIVVEPLVQAAGGMKFHDAKVLRGVRASADRHGILLIFDESFTGFGRTGAMFACEAAGVLPDIVTLSKALTGGTLPLAATVMRKNIFDALSANGAAPHSTFAGNAMACAAANASLDLFEQEPRLEQVAEIARQFTEGLAPCRGFAGVRAVRVKGAVGVVELRRLDDPSALQQRFIDAGVWLRPVGKAVALTPALAIEPYDLTQLIGTTVKVLHEATRRRRSGRAASPDQVDLPL